MLLAAADGVADTRIATERGVTGVSVRERRTRFEAEKLTQCGKVHAGRGRKATINDAKIAEIVDLTRHHVPESHTLRMPHHGRARRGQPRHGPRIWDARGLKPHRVETGKLSNDPQFEDERIDGVGLYLDLPEKAIALCLDERSQM